MSIYPFSYWIVVGLIITGVVLSIRRIRDGTGIPMLAVIGTVAVWYVGDAYYNDYARSYYIIFDSDVLNNAWWQVAWFLVVFILGVPYLHQRFNARYLRRQSGIYQLARFGVDQPDLQKQLNIFFGGCLIAYAVIVLLATLRVGSQIPYFFFPFLGHKAEPWGRGRIGSGFDSLLSVAFNIQMLLSAVFGVLAAASTNKRTRIICLVLCFISWPYFLFDRTRNTILAVVIPALLSWVFLRLRGGIWKKVVVLAVGFVLLNGWMAFIIQNRSNEDIASAFSQKGFKLGQEEEVHHQGLNMFEELGWINTFMKNGTYEPNWGARYFAELVNPIPRVIWSGKPLIGIDYAKARGQGLRNQNGSKGQEEEVYATVSTGLIGQGEVNFGRIFGPAAAALLMSFWVAILARQDLNILKLGRLPLYALGLILTFNLGRDVTLITLYPYVFLAGALWGMERYLKKLGIGSEPDDLPSSSAAQSAWQNPQGRRSAGRSAHVVTRRKRGVVTRFYPPHGPGPSRSGSANPPA